MELLLAQELVAKLVFVKLVAKLIELKYSCGYVGKVEGVTIVVDNKVLSERGMEGRTVGVHNSIFHNSIWYMYMYMSLDRLIHFHLHERDL